MGKALRIVPALLVAAFVGFGASGHANQAAAKRETARAIFAGGCFWCMEPPFEKIDGVSSVVSGYTDGRTRNPTYEQVSAGVTGHTEAVEIVYDPAKVTYEKLLDVFWRNIDPLTANAQFCDHGTQYRSGIYYLDEAQKKLAEESKRMIVESKRFAKEIQTQIVAASAFYRAEEYHQDFYKKNPVRYYSYRAGCGRDRKLQELWGKDAGQAGGSR
jgi:peptide-methionine (S)-S-oxide reductase